MLLILLQSVLLLTVTVATTAPTKPNILYLMAVLSETAAPRD